MKKGAVKTFQKAAMAQQSPACWDDYARETAHHAGTGMVQSRPHIPVDYNFKSAFHLEISQIEEIL